MPLDAICLSALVSELAPALEGGRIDKLQQPERDMLLLSVRAHGENLKLLIAVGTGNARLHLTEASFENPAEPPMFCMLLRKHLVGARIVKLTQPVGERLVDIRLQCRDELGFESEKRLVAELIGRSSNVALVDSEGRIIDCLRRMDYAGDALRRMLPGMIYRLPPAQNKRPIFDTSATERSEAIAGADRSVPVDKWLLDYFSGLSPLICRELAFGCGGDYRRLPELLDGFCDRLQAGRFQPYVLLEDGRPFDFSFMPIAQYGDRLSCRREESFSALLDGFYSARDRQERQRRRGHELGKTLRTLRDRQERKLAGQREELRRTDDREERRRMAELITANIYRIRKGDRALECEDYFEDGCPVISIPLDVMKTPQQNAAALYKEYGKLKAAREHLTVLIDDGQRQLDYLNSVLELISRAENEKDISDIRRELVETGFLKRQKNAKPDRSRAQGPLRFISDEGFEILAGRSNIQNDELCQRIGRRTDYWLHTKLVHGSHVIVRCNGVEPGEETLRQAASIAVYYSQASDGGKTPVDCTMLRFVKKPAGALPGKVLYTDYRTLTAQSDEELIKRLRKP